MECLSLSATKENATKEDDIESTFQNFQKTNIINLRGNANYIYTKTIFNILILTQSYKIELICIYLVF